jgi:hypothetical protein
LASKLSSVTSDFAGRSVTSAVSFPSFFSTLITQTEESTLALAIWATRQLPSGRSARAGAATRTAKVAANKCLMYSSRVRESSLLR